MNKKLKFIEALEMAGITEQVSLVPKLTTQPLNEIETERQKDLEKIKKLNRTIQAKISLGGDVSKEKITLKQIQLKWQKRKIPLIR